MWTAIAKELLKFVKAVGPELALETMRAIQRDEDPRKAAERIIQAELIQRSYRPHR